MVTVTRNRASEMLKKDLSIGKLIEDLQNIKKLELQILYEVQEIENDLYDLETKEEMIIKINYLIEKSRQINKIFAPILSSFKSFEDRLKQSEYTIGGYISDINDDFERKTGDRYYGIHNGKLLWKSGK